MNITRRNDSHFLNLMENEQFAIAYLSSKDAYEFTSKRLIELKKELKTLQFKYNIKNQYLSVISIFKFTDSFDKIQKEINSQKLQIQKCINDIEVFEANLVSLILYDIIDIKTAKDLGHDYEYIQNLLNKYKDILKNPDKSYHYNEKSGRTSQILPSGKYITLPYTPQVITKELRKEYIRYAK